MPFSSNPQECYECKDLREELSKLRSLLRAIAALPIHYGLAGDFDETHWIDKSRLDALLNSKEYV